MRRELSNRPTLFSSADRDVSEVETGRAKTRRTAINFHTRSRYGSFLLFLLLVPIQILDHPGIAPNYSLFVYQATTTDATLTIAPVGVSNSESPPTPRTLIYAYCPVPTFLTAATDQFIMLSPIPFI
jgi:hypothetical protein